MLLKTFMQKVSVKQIDVFLLVWAGIKMHENWMKWFASRNFLFSSIVCKKKGGKTSSEMRSPSPLLWSGVRADNDSYSACLLK